jgi:hypothetical protein
MTPKELNDKIRAAKEDVERRGETWPEPDSPGVLSTQGAMG